MYLQFRFHDTKLQWFEFSARNTKFVCTTTSTTHRKMYKGWHHTWRCVKIINATKQCMKRLAEARVASLCGRFVACLGIHIMLCVLCSSSALNVLQTKWSGRCEVSMYTSPYAPSWLIIIVPYYNFESLISSFFLYTSIIIYAKFESTC